MRILSQTDTKEKKQSSFSSLKPQKIIKISEVFTGSTPKALALSEKLEDISIRCFKEARQACRTKNWSLLQSLSKDLDTCVNALGHSLLITAVREKNKKLVKDLVNKRISIHLLDPLGNNALHHAVAIRSLSLISILHKHFSTNEPNHRGKTALHIAVEKGPHTIVKALCKNSASCTRVAEYTGGLFLDPLQAAIMGGEIKRLQAILKSLKGNWTFPNEKTIGNVLHLAIHFRHNALLEYLIEEYPSKIKTLLEKPNSLNQTPLMMAASIGLLEAIYILKKKGVNLEKKNSERQRAIHMAVSNRQTEALKLLAYFGVKLNKRDNKRKTPLDLLEKAEDSDGKSIYGLLSKLIDRSKSIDSMPNLLAQRPPENLILTGGDIRGMTYIGMMQALEKDKNFSKLRRICGGSAGALTAAAIAMGCSASAFEKALEMMKPLSIKSSYRGLTLTQAIKKQELNASLKAMQALDLDSSLSIATKTLYQSSGIYEGKGTALWVESLIKEQTGIDFCSFGELNKLIYQGKMSHSKLAYKHLYIHLFSLKNQKMICLNSEDPKYDKIIISDAVRASMMIPCLFAPHSLYKKEDGKRIFKDWGSFVDGKLFSPQWMESFDQKKFQSSDRENGDYPLFNPRSLGFSPSYENIQKDEKKEDSLANFLESFLQRYRSSQHQGSASYNKERILDLDLPSFVPHKISSEDQKELFASAYRCSSSFYKRYQTQTEQSIFTSSYKERKKGLHIPAPDTQYVKREAYLKTLEQDLLLDAKAEILQKVLCGPGGIGKSELAKSFAHTFRDSFVFSFYIDADTPSLYRKSYRDLAKALDVFYDKDTPFNDLREDLHKALSEKREKPWLLVFDNIDADKKTRDTFLKLPTKGNGRILITSRAKWARQDCIHVDVFTEEEALSFLEEVTGEKTEDSIKLIKALSAQPLALAQAAFYIAENAPLCTAKNYLSNLRTNFKELLTQKSLTKHSSLLATWKLTEKRLTKRHPDTLAFLRFAAQLHPDNIPYSFLEQWLGDDQSKKDTIYRNLRNYGLMKTHDQGFSIHRLQQKLLNHEKSEKAEQEVLSFLLRETNKLEPHNYRDREKIRLLEAHLFHFLANFSEKDSLQIASLKYFLADWLWRQRQYTEAKKFSLEALAIRKKSLKPNDPYIADSLNNLADCYKGQGQYKKAEKYYLEALIIKKESLKPNDPSIASSLNNLANCYYAQRQYKKAKKHYLEALAIKKESLEPNDPKIANSLNNLANCYYAQRQYKQAEKYHLEALAIYRKSLEPNDPNIATSLCNLASCYSSQRQYKKAEKYHLEALAIYRESLEPNDPYIAISLYNLACCYKVQRQYKEAANCFEGAFTIYGKCFGPQHEKTLNAKKQMESCQSSCIIS